jgi:hypothetical protein
MNDMNEQIVDLSDDDLKQVSAGVNKAAAEAANNAATVWRQCGYAQGGAYFDGMATAFGYWTY